jgi:nitrogen regulatory protein PII-like uncharacterized protein
VELPDKSRRRMLINVMFTMGVFRLGLSKILKVSPDVLRLWLISGDHESLIDLSKDAPANGVVQGSVLQVEQADDKGVFKKVENTLTQSTEARFMQESKRVMQEPPPPSHPQHVAAPSSAAHRPPPAAHHQPPPSPPPRVTSEDEQIKQAINASLAAQTTALEKEEALIMALATANKKMRKVRCFILR